MSMMGNSPFGGGTGGDEDNIGAVDLNMTPLMDVLSNILFFLLASFGAAILSYLAASVPIQAESDASESEPRTDKVTVNIKILTTGYRVNLSADDIDPEKMNKYRQTIPMKKPDEYDVHTLNELVYAVKQEFPASDTAMIVPNTDTKYDQIVLTMDAVKDRGLVDPESEKPEKILPKMVIADIVRAETVDGEKKKTQ